jgi:hypothetical protein
MPQEEHIMKTILAGNFATKAKADRAIKALRDGGIHADHINSSFGAGLGMKGGAGGVGDSVAESIGKMIETTIDQSDDTVTAGHAPGVHVSVDSPLASERAFAASVMRKAGAQHVAEAEQTWVNGRWVDSR